MLTIIAVCEKQFFLQVIIKKERQMDLENVISKLNESSKTKYYKFTYKGDGRCRICPQYDGKVFPEDKLPQTHPNCKCAKETSDPIDIALGKFLPSQEYFVGRKNFNDNRRKLETKYGKQIDNNPHSEPQYKLVDMIKRDGYIMALYRHIAIREGKFARPYPDGKNIPTVGVGANMTEEYIIRELLNMKAISLNTANTLRNFHRYDKNSQDTINLYLERQLKLTEHQIQQLFEKSFTVAQKDAQSVLSKGKWIKQKDKNGKSYMIWNDNVVDNTTWQKMPDSVKAICVDLSFNTGGNQLAKYKNFIKAVKAEDYRRAALELLDSRDFNKNINNRNTRGVAIRRRDAAIELTELAEEIQ